MSQGLLPIVAEIKHFPAVCLRVEAEVGRCHVTPAVTRVPFQLGSATRPCGTERACWTIGSTLKSWPSVRRFRPKIALHPYGLVATIDAAGVSFRPNVADTSLPRGRTT
jgi:hypothetical protein